MPENNSISNIKPCPFCGRTDVVVRSETIPVFGDDRDIQEVAVYQVCCEACNAEGPSIYVEMTAKHTESEAIALQQWGQRTGQGTDSPVDFKNCPFCGGQPEVLRDPGPEESDADSESTIVEIFCSDCGATGPTNDKTDLAELWNKRMIKDEKLWELIANTQKAHDITKGIKVFREKMWEKWKALYKDPGFIYNAPGPNGIFSVTGRTYEVDTNSGVIATYSPGRGDGNNKTPEYKYSRDLFNRKKIRINNTSNAGGTQELIFFSYEAPLLRVTTEKGGQFRIRADLIALADQNIVILEAKLPGGDPLDKAILQAYGYAFFLACHLANDSNGAVSEHIKESLKKFQKSDNVTSNIKVDQPVQYMIVAPSQYFYENLIVSENVGVFLSELGTMESQFQDKPPTDCALPVNPQFAGFVVIEENYLHFNELDQLMQYQADVCNWQGFDKSLSYADAERLAQIRCKRYSGLFSKGAQGPGEYKYRGKLYKVAYCLPRKKHWEENLFEEIRGEAVDFFDKRKISWHHKGQNHLLSSQIYCVNFLFQFVDEPKALQKLFEKVYGNIKQMCPPVEGDNKYVIFEWDGGENHLKEHGYNKSRGAFATYFDAAVKFERTDGKKQLVLIEWKYTERYNEKSLAKSSETKASMVTYRECCKDSDCPVKLKTLNPQIDVNSPTDQDIDNALSVLFYEPFYQLFREQLLANEIEKNNNDIDIVSVLHICPKENEAYLKNTTSPTLKKMYPEKNVLQIWEVLLKHKDRFKSTSQKELFQNFLKNTPTEFKNWADYMSVRYRLEK